MKFHTATDLEQMEVFVFIAKKMAIAALCSLYSR